MPGSESRCPIKVTCPANVQQPLDRGRSPTEPRCRALAGQLTLSTLRLTEVQDQSAPGTPILAPVRIGNLQRGFKFPVPRSRRPNRESGENPARVFPRKPLGTRGNRDSESNFKFPPSDEHQLPLSASAMAVGSEYTQPQVSCQCSHRDRQHAAPTSIMIQGCVREREHAAVTAIASPRAATAQVPTSSGS
jgi:hypothetical protein